MAGRATRIKGISIVLYTKTISSRDGFKHPLYSEQVETVTNVLAAPAGADEIPTTLDLSGYKSVYTLGIPKGDAHTWTGCDVEFFGHRWRVVAEPQGGIEDLIPLDWNKKVLVARYG